MIKQTVKNCKIINLFINKISQNCIFEFKHIVMIVEIHIILHVANGIHIIIQVYLHEFIYKY